MDHSASLPLQFGVKHLALILSVALVLSAFLLITNPSTLQPMAQSLSLQTQTTTFYNDMYAQSTQASAGMLAAAPSESGSVAGTQIVLLRGPVALRGQP